MALRRSGRRERAALAHAPRPWRARRAAARLREGAPKNAAQARAWSVSGAPEIDKHGKRKGAVAPERTTKRPEPATAKPPKATSTIPAMVRREVWKRDGGRCAWVGPGGCRCKSRWKLELDHIQPVALGGSSTIDNLRLVCRRPTGARAASPVERNRSPGQQPEM